MINCGFNRCLIPRLTIVVGDRVQPDPTDQAPYTDTEVANLFEHNKRRSRKQPRDSGNNNISNNNTPFPPQKRRKVNAKRNISNIHQRVDAIVNDKNDNDLEGSDKTRTANIDEQKQKSFPRSSLHSALAPTKHFSIFTQKFSQAKDKNRKPRTGKLKVHPLGNNQKITQHFSPVSLELDKSKGPNDPEVESDQKTEDRGQLRFVG